MRLSARVCNCQTFANGCASWNGASSGATRSSRLRASAREVLVGETPPSGHTRFSRWQKSHEVVIDKRNDFSET